MSAQHNLAVLTRALRREAMQLRHLRQTDGCGAHGTDTRMAAIEIEHRLDHLADDLDFVVRQLRPERPRQTGWRAWWLRAMRRPIA